MHGSYTHRITCNLYPTQYYLLERAAEKVQLRLAPFVRDAALAFVEQRQLIPPKLETLLENAYQQIRRIGSDLHEITERANMLQRITHRDLQIAARMVKELDRQVTVLRAEIASLPRSS